MLLYLARHGEAKTGEEDRKRPLTAAGEAAVRRAAATLARLEPPVQEIWHSGKLRARQTAGLFAAALRGGGKARAVPQERPDLDPGASPRVLVEQLRRVEGNLLIVGHLPHLARLATALVFGREAPQALDLAAAAVICLERSGDSWALKWLLSPELCRWLRPRARNHEAK